MRLNRGACAICVSLNCYAIFLDDVIPTMCMFGETRYMYNAMFGFFFMYMYVHKLKNMLCLVLFLEQPKEILVVYFHFI